MRYVYDFDEDSGGGRELLGGKGIGLVEMTELGVPVPAGFTITTDACRAYMAAGGDVPEGLDGEVDQHLAALEDRTGKRFGDEQDPLLVSVRSGAAVSMPGMMDTVLNLGLDDVAVEGLAKSHRQRALRLRLVPPPDPDVRRGRGRRRRASLRAGARRPQGRRAERRRTWTSRPTTFASWSGPSRRSTKTPPATASRRTPVSSSAARIAPSSTRGMRHALRSTGAPTRSRTISAPP